MSGEAKKCRICHKDSFHSVLSLGDMPLVDNFLEEEDIGKEDSYPLELLLCDNCGLVQLSYVVSPEKMFHSDYAYDMSVTGAGVEHFINMAEDLDCLYPEKNSVLDIGSNTGVLLEGFKENGWEILGIEPSSNVYNKSVEKGIPTLNDFFSSDVAEKVKKRDGRKDLITATNVFAHINDLHDTVKGVKNLLKTYGVFIIEVPYLLDLIEKNEFDTIYHEHLSYFSVKPLRKLFRQHGLEIIDIEKQDIHGGSLRIHIAREGVHNQSSSVEKFRALEEKKNLHSLDTLQKFRSQVHKNRKELQELIQDLTDQGETIAGVGAPAKGVILLNYCNLDETIMPYVSEKSELKTGKYIPGTHNKVISDKEMLKKQPDYALLLPWNFAESIIENLSKYLENGGKFILPIPEPHIIESKNELDSSPVT